MSRIHNATLIVEKLDRLSRNATFLLGLRDANVDFIACDLPSASRLTIGILACVAENEAMMISARTKSALQAAKARGVKLGGPKLTEHARELGRAQSAQVRRACAVMRAGDLEPLIRELQGLGHRTLAALAFQLNSKQIPTVLVQRECDRWVDVQWNRAVRLRGGSAMHELPGGPCRFEPCIARGPDFGGATGQAISGRDVADRTV